MKKSSAETTRRWVDYLRDSGVREELCTVYEEYIADLTSHGLPVIFEFRHLAQLLGRTPQYLASAVNSPESHYRSFRIPKRRGGYREISAPYPALLECQRWVSRHILSSVGTHRAAHGFVGRRSCATNAGLHLEKRCLLKMDLKDFFPSIELPQVLAVFRRLGYPSNVSFYLARLCCCDGRLPQGAATSPALSNIVAYGLDIRLAALARKYRLIYSRYADDMAFSGKNIPVAFSGIVGRIAAELGFEINTDKTRLCRSKGQRIVTGLSVAGDRLRIPREYKRKLRQEVHYILMYGSFSHMHRRKLREPFYLDSIYGKLVYWSSIEPDDSFVQASLPRIRELMMLTEFVTPQPQ